MYIGIDPGKSGGIVGLLNAPIGIIIACCKPFKDIDNAKTSIELCLEYKAEKTIAMMENVHAFPTDGRSSAFKFGKNAGQWEGLLTGFNIPFSKVVPHIWMSFYGEMPKEKIVRKRKLKQYAQAEIDKVSDEGIKATLKTADAYLIANYFLRRGHIGAYDGS